MREIKFRAWDFNAKQMQQVTALYFELYRLREIETLEHKGAYIRNFANPQEITVMQYIGLKDKNGKEIYEGDVVEAKTVERSPIAPDYVSGYLKGVIEYYGNSFCIKYKDKKGQYTYNHLWTNAEEWHVLGNIHENKELLND